MSNDLQAVEQGQQMATVESSTASSMALMMNDDNMRRAMSMATIMAAGKVTVPKHLQGNEGDCLAVVFQAMNWGMNPFAVAQKTHLVGSTLGYEAQLVNAVIQESGAIKGRFHYEYLGEGAALQCRVGAIIRGESEVTWGEWLKSSDVTTKNSPLWKTNPKQQLGYLQVKNWSRAFCPGAILGVYTPDELEEKDITPPRRQTGAQAAESARGQAQAGASESITPAMRDNAILDLELVAREQGAEEYKAAWAALTKAFRVSIGVPERDRIMKIAESIQGEATESVDPETGEVSHD